MRPDRCIDVLVRCFLAKSEHLRQLSPVSPERVDNKRLALADLLESRACVSSERIIVDWVLDLGISDNHTIRANRHGYINLVPYRLFLAMKTLLDMGCEFSVLPGRNL